MMKMRCGWCKAKVPQPGRGRPRLYCNRSCQQRAYEVRRLARNPRRARQALAAPAKKERELQKFKAYCLETAGVLLAQAAADTVAGWLATQLCGRADWQTILEKIPAQIAADLAEDEAAAEADDAA